MALPLSTGSNPEIATIPKDVWTKAFSDIKNARVARRFSATKVLWLTYVSTSDPSPTNLTGPMWRVLDDTNFKDVTTNRDVYLYAVDSDLDVTLES